MARPSKYKKEACGICGKLSYLRPHKTRNPQIRNDKYRKSWRWEHIDTKTAPKTHYKKADFDRDDLLKQISISDERFEELLNSPRDTIRILEKYNLTLEQINKLPDEEKKEYLHLRDLYVARETGNKILNRIQRTEQRRLRELTGIKTIEDEQKVSTTKPPKEYWGESGTRNLLLKLSKEFNIVSESLSKPPWKDDAAIEGQLEVSENFKTLSKQMNKLASSIYYFKPSPETDSKNIQNYNEWYEKSIKLIYILLKNLGLRLDRQSRQIDSNNKKLKEIEAMIKLKYEFQLISDVLIGITTELKYVVGERYLLPFSGWLKVLVDRYKNYTIRGTAEKNLLRTGEYVMRLGSNQDEIDKAKKEGRLVPKFHHIVYSIPVATALTAKHIKNMTKLRVKDRNNKTQYGLLVQDLLNILQGRRAQMELGMTEKDEEIYNLIRIIGVLPRFFPS